MDATLLILEQRFATFILLNVYRNPGIIKCEAIDFDGGAGRAKYITLEKLINAGLIKEDERTFKHNKKLLYCTEMGNKVCELLEKAHSILPPKECSSDDYRGNANLWD